MLRKCYFICRIFSPRNLVVSVILFSTIYLVLLKYTGTRSHPQYPETTQQGGFHAAEMNRNVGSARSTHVFVVTDPRELEIARQTLTFLSSSEENVDVKTVEKSKLTTTLTSGLCPETNSISDFRGSLPQAVLLIENLQEADVIAAHPEVKLGGEWKPTDCKARHKVAIIIPFRDRQSHLTRLLDFLIPILQRQRLDFRFIVTEQYGNDLFNKGAL
ncbi:hypothetical protein KIN20_027689 [Parelaphostrongylus tenuis]|uniref:Galactosyltransferase N-terminal domain-containing protein n=1 Tax=Parelaphostrongylus tenuis TaxID=148309 RepID=A0AAD5QZP5_PARTN|nr:hypothetical protein KIN20_027689 [Parelaphostrongylus tenuis]